MSVNFNLNKSDREQIVLKAIAFAFDKEEAALKADETKLAEDVYCLCVSKKTRDALSAIHESYLMWETSVCARICGRDVRIYGYGTRFAVKPSQRYGAIGVIDDQAISERLMDLETRCADFKARKERAIHSLNAMIARCKSFRALEKAWPEGKAFYEELTPKAPGLPMIQVADLNAMLGLAPTATEEVAAAA